MNFTLHTFSEEGAFWAQIKADFASIQAQNIAASGGSAANIFDQKICSVNNKIWLADERFVPENHADSNARLLRSKGVNQNLISWRPQDFDTPEACVTAYAKNLPESFDLTILGVGPDGHTASLFPHGGWLEPTDQRCLVTHTDEFSVRDRLSLSFEEIEKSKRIWILMMGAGKRDILEKITDERTDFHDFPARRILDMGACVYYLEA